MCYLSLNFLDRLALLTPIESHSWVFNPSKAFKIDLAFARTALKLFMMRRYALNRSARTSLHGNGLCT